MPEEQFEDRSGEGAGGYPGNFESKTFKDQDPRDHRSSVVTAVRIGGYLLQFEVPQGWLETDEYAEMSAATWMSQDRHELLLIGHGGIPSGMTIKDFSITSLYSSLSEEERKNFILGIEWEGDDGTIAYSARYRSLEDESTFFKFELAKELDGLWFSMEFLAHNDKLDNKAQLAEKYRTLAASFTVQRIKDITQ